MHIMYVLLDYVLFLSIDVGDLFSVMDLRCVNYTAEFRWSVNSQLADTLLHLFCHNTTNVCNGEDPCNNTAQ